MLGQCKIKRFMFAIIFRRGSLQIHWRISCIIIYFLSLFRLLVLSPFHQMLLRLIDRLKSVRRQYLQVSLKGEADIVLVIFVLMFLCMSSGYCIIKKKSVTSYHKTCIQPSQKILFDYKMLWMNVHFFSSSSAFSFTCCPLLTFK